MPTSRNTVWLIVVIFCSSSTLFLPAESHAQSLSFVYFKSEVGAGLQDGYTYARLSDSQHGGITVRIESSDTLLALVAPNATSPGAPFVDVFVPNGSINATFYTHALEDTTGTAAITATAPGFSSVSDQVEVVQPALQLLNLAGNIDILDPDDPFQARVGIPTVTNGGLYAVQKARVGGPGLTATVSNSMASVAQLVTSTLTGQVVSVSIAPGESDSPETVASGGVAFDGLSADTTVVSATIPGFIQTDLATKQVVVEASSIDFLTFPAKVGAGFRSNGIVARLSGSGHGGVTVHIESGDSSLALVTDHSGTPGRPAIDIFLADGSFDASFYICGLEDTTGIVTVTASASGFSSRVEPTQIVQPAVEIYGLGTTIDVLDAPDDFYVQVGIPRDDLLGLEVFSPARPGGSGFVSTVTSSDSTVGQQVTLTDTSHTVNVLIPPGQYRTPSAVSLGGVAFDGIALGTTTVSASIPGFLPTQDAFVDVSVSQPEVTFLFQPDELGAGLRTNQIRAQLGASQHGGVTVHIEVDDPAIALVSDHGDSVGQPAVDVFLNNGSIVANYYLHALEDTSGTVMLTASAPGFTPDTITVDVVQPGVMIYANSLGGSIDTLDPSDAFYKAVGTPNATNTSVAPLELRPGSPGVTITVSSSDSTVGLLQTLTDTSGVVTVHIPAGSSTSPLTVATGGVALDGVTPGVTTVTCSAPGFVSTTAASKTVTVTAPTTGLIGFPAAVGAGLQSAQLRVNLSASNHGGITVLVESADSSIALVSSSPDSAGRPFADVYVPDGTLQGSFYVHGVDDTTGTVLINVSAPGFVSTNGTADILEPAVEIRNLAASVDVSDAPDEFIAAVGLPDVGLSTVPYIQKRRAGAPPLVVTVASSDSTTADLVTLADTSGTVTIEIQPGDYFSASTVAAGGVALRGLGSGQTIVSVDIPGFIQVGDGTQVVDVTNQNISLLGVPSAVGAGLQSGVVTARLGESSHGGVTIQIASADWDIVLLSSDPGTEGSPTLEIPVLNGQTDALFYVHGVDDTTGSVAITADATGFASGSDVVDVVTPAVQIALLPDSADIVEPDVEFVVQIGVANAGGSSLEQFQPIRAGGTARTVTLISSDGSIGELATTTETEDTVEVSIPVGGFETAGTVASGGVAFHPVSNGVTTVSAEIFGFTTTDAGSVDVRVVGDPTGIEDDVPPARLALDQNHPNPFNPSTTISFTLPTRTKTVLSIYNVEGKLVATLVDETLDAGFKDVTWHGKDVRGNQVSTGVYFYRLTAGNQTLTKKMVLLK
ncbi:MAG: T9SS type A sorting domain-containing protein [Candidatus Latescibacterota bacterium]|nr:MAG: T9SS type A sorting domain-containing protein [Candidatus Latescibacterota bacterium]